MKGYICLYIIICSCLHFEFFLFLFSLIFLLVYLFAFLFCFLFNLNNLRGDVAMRLVILSNHSSPLVTENLKITNLVTRQLKTLFEFVYEIINTKKIMKKLKLAYI